MAHPDELRELYWRDEIVQVVLWLRGEGGDERIDAPTLQRFLGLDPAASLGHLRSLVDRGVLQVLRDGRYALTPYGEQIGERIVAGRTAEVPQPREGPCGRECWCYLDGVPCEAG